MLSNMQYLDSVEFDLAALALPITEIELAMIDQCGVAFPAQWDAITTDGRELYIRFRDGALSVSQPLPDGMALPVFLQRIAWPACMSTQSMLEFTGLRMAS